MKPIVRLAAVAFGLLFVMAFLTTTHRTSASGSYFFGFESSLKPFAPSVNGSHYAPGLGLERVVGENGCPAMDGKAYANLKMTNIGAKRVEPLALLPSVPGTWIETWLPDQGSNSVTIWFSAKNTDSCATCHAITYAGDREATNRAQFSTQQESLTDGWHRYHWTTTVKSTKGIYLAVGWDGDYGSMGIDCVNVEVKSLTATAANAAK